MEIEIFNILLENNTEKITFYSHKTGRMTKYFRIAKDSEDRLKAIKEFVDTVPEIVDIKIGKFNTDSIKPEIIPKPVEHIESQEDKDIAVLREKEIYKFIKDTIEKSR
jgi:hypothetical protein